MKNLHFLYSPDSHSPRYSCDPAASLGCRDSCAPAASREAHDSCDSTISSGSPNLSDSPASHAPLDVLCVGQAVVDCITRGQRTDPARPEVSVAESITLSVGGDAVNESIALVSYGRTAGVVIGVGRDPAGQLLLNTLAERGVDTSRAAVMPSPFATPIANLSVRTDGSRSSVNSPATRLTGFRPAPELLRGAKIISLASLFRAPLDDPQTIASLVRAAKEDGALVCADTKLPTFRTLSLDDLADVLPLIDYIFPNEKEAAFYTKKEAFEEMADVFLSCGVRHVVVKTGPKGCFAKDENGAFEIPALPVKAVDTTGAGDHFVAGFLTALLDNQTFFDCCKNGIARAAESVSRSGGA